MACALSVPAGATAQSATGGVGIFAGYAFGSENGVEWGIEGFGMVPFTDRVCASSFAAGPLVQFALIGLARPRLTLALHGGQVFDQRNHFALTGEVGVSRWFGPDPGWGIHLGLTPEWLLVNASLRGDPVRHHVSTVLGVRALTTYGVDAYSGCGLI